MEPHRARKELSQGTQGPGEARELQVGAKGSREARMDSEGLAARIVSQKVV